MDLQERRKARNAVEVAYVLREVRDLAEGLYENYRGDNDVAKADVQDILLRLEQLPQTE